MSASARSLGNVINELYLHAWEHLAAARRAKSELADTWANLLDAGLAQESVVTDPDGSGRISVYAIWAPDSRDELTNVFRTCVGELWACLDSLVTESVAMFSILKRPRNPDRPRFFPMADSAETFDALLEDSCLDGVLKLHFDMVRDCQPFQQVPEDERVERFRAGLRQLLDWTHSLEDGSRIGAWVTPFEPQVHVVEPVRLLELEVLKPGDLDVERDVARYRLTNHVAGSKIYGQAGAYVDLAFPDGFIPHSDEDTFDSRLNLVIDVVERFAVSFAWLAGKAPGTKQLRLGPNHKAGASWIAASQSARRWANDELAALNDSDIGVGVVSDTEQLTLLVATANGVYERIIPDATPLRGHIKRGTAAERAVEEAAGTWGLPDFVMRSQVERKGRGVREVSDGLMVVGDRGVIVQVKSREADVSHPEREASWLAKHIISGAKQVNGTARWLSSKTTRMVNGRGRTIMIDGRTIEWVGAVIIDHPAPPTDFAIPEIHSRIPTLVLLRRDWEFLFGQLRSSRAVIDYLNRTSTSSTRLGGEPERYYELAAADAIAPPGEIDPSLKRLGTLRSVPLLPTAPAGSDDDEAHRMVRIMCEDIATTHIDSHTEEDRLRVLAAIDRLLVGHRTELGRLLLDGLQAAARTAPEGISWQFRTFRAGRGQEQLGFGVCSKFTEETRAAFTSWLLLRHHERGTVEPLADATSIGILLTPRADGLREWDTTMAEINGDPELSEQELGQYPSSGTPNTDYSGMADWP
jgi:hypothetical protein